MTATCFITVLPIRYGHSSCSFAPGLQKRELRASSKAPRKLYLPRINYNTVSCIGETPDSSANDDYKKPTFSKSRSMRENSVPEIDESIIKAKELEEARERAQMYAQMTEYLGPPTNRFNNAEETTEAEETDTLEVNETSSRSTSDTTSNEPPDLPHNSSADNPTESEPMKTYAQTFEEEYELIETLLRGGAKSNLPRRGRRRKFPRNVLMDQAFITDPWNTNYNLMRKKSAQKRKALPSKRGPPSMRNPKYIEMSLDGIEQSYQVLEKILDDEERDWEREQERIEKIQAEKREAHQQRRAFKKAQRRGDVALAKNSPETKPGESMTESRIVQTPEAEKGEPTTETLSSDSENLEKRKTPSEGQKVGAEQKVQQDEGSGFVPPKVAKNASITHSIPPYWTLNPPIQRKYEGCALLDAQVISSPIPFQAQSNMTEEDEKEDEDEQPLQSIKPSSKKQAPIKDKRPPKVRAPSVLKLNNPKVWKGY